MNDKKSPMKTPMKYFTWILSFGSQNCATNQKRRKNWIIYVVKNIKMSSIVCLPHNSYDSGFLGFFVIRSALFRNIDGKPSERFTDKDFAGLEENEKIKNIVFISWAEFDLVTA